MDLVVEAIDDWVLDPYVYGANNIQWPRDLLLRQALTLLVVVNASAYILYLSIATLSYFFVFDHRLMSHKKWLPNQIRREMTLACTSIPLMSIPTISLFLAEIRGYSKLYNTVDEFGITYLIFSTIWFMFFNDMCIYAIHRGLHHPLVYSHIHKPHHYWLIASPFASHAFHPVDGFLQSTPYHIFVFLFPLHKLTYIVLFVFVNMWTISIHDGNYRVPSSLQPFVNGAAHHTDHHLYFNVNYGQYFTLWDRIGSSFRYPTALQGKGPLDDILSGKTKSIDNDNKAVISTITVNGKHADGHHRRKFVENTECSTSSSRIIKTRKH